MKLSTPFTAVVIPLLHRFFSLY